MRLVDLPSYPPLRDSRNPAQRLDSGRRRESGDGATASSFPYAASGDYAAEMPGSIVCCVDASAEAQDAVRVARGLAAALGLEMVVLGTRGRGRLRTALLGSVSADVAGKAHCIVVLVPPGAAE